MFNLGGYADKRICVAVSGGRDSMALLHFIYAHARESGIALSALHCNHKIRALTADRDEQFVASWCSQRGIPLLSFVWEYDGIKTEQAARDWRRECYKQALKSCDLIALAHHLDDNAETILFNLARGSSLAGLCGIGDGDGIIRPLINCTRAQIDEYIINEKIEYFDDETNFTDCYTRNKIRLDVLPALERAVPHAAQNIFRFSRLAAEDEEYFKSVIAERGILNITPFGVEIKLCEPVVFRRAAVRAIKYFNKKNYTCEQLQRLYALANGKKNKKFCFLGLTAYGGGSKIIITDDAPNAEIDFALYGGENFCGQKLIIFRSPDDIPVSTGEKVLKFDLDALPENTVIKFKKGGERFAKFGGGTKSLGDYFTDLKIPIWVRGRVPLICSNNEVLAVCGVEIGSKIKVTQNTKNTAYILCCDYRIIKESL